MEPANEINFEDGQMDRSTQFQKRPGSNDDFVKTGELINRIKYKKIFGKIYIKKKSFYFKQIYFLNRQNFKFIFIFGCFFLSFVLIFLKESLCILCSIDELNFLSPLAIFAAPQSL